MDKKNQRIGIALSGGGARGVAHIGILKALEEFGIKPAVISGTSAGAIAGAFYSRGFTFPEIINIIKKGHFFSFSNILIKKQGFFSMKGFESIYKQYFPTNTFSDLQIPVYIAATDILKGEIVYFSSGDLSRSLMASSCIPIVFQPVKYLDTMFVDGGVLDNLPIEPLLNQCDKIIGVNVNSFNKEVKEIHFKNIFDRSFHLALSHSMRDKFQKCHLVIEPPNMTKYTIFDLKKIEEIFNYGYNYALSMEDEIKKLL
ncbi:MAG: patatin [Bacteroidetes bacterium HGW-Bacteroidetes-21]|jgi:NTE family protein|nr:MAG: patatin [Bacteroidetes bacterium HGW-Bacteroidetes-21]